MLPCSVGYFLTMSHILLMYNIWHVRSLCMHRCKQNSKHENVPPSLHRIQQALYPSAFSFFLDLSHFILIPPVCFFYHLSLCVFLPLLPICSCLCSCLMLCLSVSLRIPDLSSVKSSLHLDFKFLMGMGLWGGWQEWGTGGALFTGEKSSEKIRKESKGWVHEARHVCSAAGFKRRHFNRLSAASDQRWSCYLGFATSKSEFQASPLCSMSNVHRQVITSIEMCVLSVLFLRITFHLLINYRKAPCWTQPNRYTQQKYKDMAVPRMASTFQNANLVRSTGCKYHPNVSRRPQKSN